MRLAEERKQWRKDHPFVSCPIWPSFHLIVSFLPRPWRLTGWLIFSIFDCVGVLRETEQINGWVYELDGVGGWYPRKTRRTSSPGLFLCFFIPWIAD